MTGELSVVLFLIQLLNPAAGADIYPSRDIVRVAMEVSAGELKMFSSWNKDHANSLIREFASLERWDLDGTQPAAWFCAASEAYGRVP